MERSLTAMENTNSAQERIRARDRALSLLSRLTAGVAVAAIAGVGVFGAVSAITIPGVSASTKATTSTSSGGGDPNRIFAAVGNPLRLSQSRLLTFAPVFSRGPSLQTSHRTMPGRTGPRMRGASNFAKRKERAVARRASLPCGK